LVLGVNQLQEVKAFPLDTQGCSFAFSYSVAEDHLLERK
jgi:hypothetical protein